ncbi:MAG: beta-lactamase family protein [Planctomycetes bacterium]|nr:beta-lactamase family protein [Planctomycetota bacterium]
MKLAGLLVCVGCQFAATAQSDDLEQQLDTAVRASTERAFFGAVLVARDGHVLFRRGYGRDVAAHAIDSGTLFDVGSIAKQFTAAAILLLEHRGKLSTDDTIDEFFRVPEDKRAITIHDLLTHRSGLPRMVRFDESERDDRDAALRRILQLEMLRPPGEAFEYSNAGYHLLAILVEQLSHRRFETFIRRELFHKAHMEHTGFVADERLDPDAAAPRWEGRRDEHYHDTALCWAWHWGFRGAAGVVTTIDDLHRWHCALQSGEVLPRPVAEKFFACRDLGTAPGWEVSETDRGTRRFSHSGRCYGFQSLFVRWPDEDACLVVLGNTESKLAPLDVDVERILFSMPPLPERLEGVPGSYELPDGGGRFDCDVVDGRLRLRAVGVDAVSRLLHGEHAGDPFNRTAFERRAVTRVVAHAAEHDDWNACLDRHGKFRRAEWIGTLPETHTSWLRATFGDASIDWKVTWDDEREVAALERAESCPFEVRPRWLCGTRFTMPSVDGLRRIDIEFESDRRSTTLHWRDVRELACERARR